MIGAAVLTASTRRVQRPWVEIRSRLCRKRVLRVRTLQARKWSAAQALNSMSGLAQDPPRLRRRHLIRPSHRRCHPSAESSIEGQRQQHQRAQMLSYPLSPQGRPMASLPLHSPSLYPRDASACSFLALKVFCSSRWARPSYPEYGHNDHAGAPNFNPQPSPRHLGAGLGGQGYSGQCSN